MKTIKLIFASLCLFCSAVVFAHDFKVDGIYYNITDATSKIVEVTYKGIDYDSYSNEYTGRVVIPESVGYNGITYSVTSIGVEAFKRCDNLTSILIPISVTSIGDYAFSGCYGLKTVINLSNLTLSKGSSDYGYVACYANKIINTHGVFVGDFIFGKPNDVNTLLGYLGNSTELTLPADYKGENYAIGNSVFENCSGLTSVVIPNSVTSIGERAFYNCSGLTSIVIPDGVTSIGDRAFYGCSGLTSIAIPNSVTSIGYRAFEGCSDLTSIEIPNSVTSIGNFAFYNCSGLTSIEIPNSVTSLGNFAFYGCSGLTSIVIPDGVTNIGAEAFSYCSGLTSIKIPNSVTSIGDSAFAGSTTMCSAFFGCSGLTCIIVEPGNPKYDSRENSNAIVETESNTLITGCKNTIIPNSVTSIGRWAFYGCEGLTSITIPNSVTSIGSSAFSGCSGLTSITIPNSVITTTGRASIHFSHAKGENTKR